MKVKRSIDIEDEIRRALSEYVAAYCRPLPKEFSLPCILVQQVGGYDTSTIDGFNVVLDARGRSEAEANECLRNAVGILRATAAQQTTSMRHISVNSSGSWGSDPARPDIAMCSARIRVNAHMETVEVNKNDT